MSAEKGKYAELEIYFTQYPDVPREVIIKEDILRMGIGLTPLL